MEIMWGPCEGRSQRAWTNRVGPDHQRPPAAPVVVSLPGQAPWRLARRRRRPRLGPVRRKRRRRRGAQLHDSPLVRHQPSSGTVTRHSPRVLQATAVSAAGHSRRTAIAGMPCQEASSPRLPWRRSSWRLRTALAALRLMSRTVTTRPTCCAQITADMHSKCSFGFARAGRAELATMCPAADKHRGCGRKCRDQCPPAGCRTNSGWVGLAHLNLCRASRAWLSVPAGHA
jgi:hypothetical protein